MGQGGKQTCGEVGGARDDQTLVLECSLQAGRGKAGPSCAGAEITHAILTAAATATPTAKTYIVWTKS